MAKVKESKVEKQQRSDAAEQAHRLAHELDWIMTICMRKAHLMSMVMDIIIQIPRQFLTGWQEPLVIWRQ